MSLVTLWGEKRMWNTSVEGLEEYKKIVGQHGAYLLELAGQASSDVVKKMLARKKFQLEDHRSHYAQIDVSSYPNVVVSRLADMQGVERTILADINLYDAPIDEKKAVDAELKLCEDIIKAKEKERGLSGAQK